ncbi:hypothetical protein VTN77DRAFT_1069 [Rasamsonia byssochlamydoides]|uniref:uncharacterized protein n=1 Tax=Rasamsonia byssochlamydoides TaxID=89139 RepID=UPI0037430600
MDPVSAFGVFTGGIQVVQVIGQTIAGLASLRGKYKNADLTIRSLIGELTTIKSAITQLHDWSTYNTQSSSRNKEYDEGLDVALDGCHAIMEVLSEEVSALTHNAAGEDNTVLGFKARVRLVWNDEMMRGLEDRLHAQVRALNLLLQACQCRSSSEQIELLRKVESRRIIQKVADDTVTLRSRTSSAVGSQADSRSINNRLSSVGETNFDFDDALVSTDAYRRALQHSRSKSDANAAIVRDPSRRTVITSSDEGYASHNTGTTIPARSLSTTSSGGKGHVLRPNDSVLPEHGRSKSVSFGANPIHHSDQNIRRWQSANAASLRTPSSTGSKREKLRSAFRRLNTSSLANLTASPSRNLVVSPTAGSTRGRRGRESDFNTSIDLTSSDGATAPLIVKAAQSGSRFDVERLIESGHDIEARHIYSRRNALMVAAHCGKEDIVDLLIQNNARLNASDASGSTALHLAACRGHLAVLELLLMEAVDLEAKTSHGRTALWVAANNGQLGAVQLLLANHAKVNARADNQMTALHIAAKQGDVEIASLLISQGADADARDATMMTALHYACEGGHLPVIELLLNNKANIDAPGSERRTPLICAAATGQLLAVQMLLKRKATFRCLDEGGMTALHWAAFNGHVEIVDLLSQKRGALSMANIQGRTALHLAAMNSQFAVVEFLLRKNPPLDIRCQSGLNPLHYACVADSPEVVRLLLTSGADIEAQIEGTQQRPIHIAAAGRSVHLLSLLCEKGASLESRDADGDRALCVACRHGHVAAVQKLLDYGSPLHLRFQARCHEDSPLCLAAMGGHLPVVSLLISRGASVLSKDEMGWQPMRYAAYYGHPEVLEVLLSCTPSLGGADNGSVADYFGLSAERIGFAPDADISEDRKRRVLDLLNRAQRQQAPITTTTFRPQQVANHVASNRFAEPISQPSFYYQSSSASTSFPLSSFATPPQELPSTLEQGLPSSRSTTPDRMHRGQQNPPGSESEDYPRSLNSVLQGRLLPVLHEQSARSQSTSLPDVDQNKNVEGAVNSHTKQRLLPQQQMTAPTVTQSQAGPSLREPQLGHGHDTDASPSQDHRNYTSLVTSSRDDNNPSLGLVSASSSSSSSSFTTPRSIPIRTATTTAAPPSVSSPSPIPPFRSSLSQLSSSGNDGGGGSLAPAETQSQPREVLENE